MSGATRSVAQAWITTDEAPGDIICYRAFLPKNYLHEFLGALFLLTRERNWETVGATDAGEVAEAFNEAYRLTLEGGNCMPPGSIMIWPSDTIPDGWLLCNGQTRLVEFDSDLFDVIGYTFGGATTYFAVPDLRGVFPMGNDGNIGDTGGAASVALTGAQNGPHTHSIHQHSALIFMQGEIPSPISPIAEYPGGSTGSSGSGEPHENRPPFMKLNFIIKR